MRICVHHFWIASFIAMHKYTGTQNNVGKLLLSICIGKSCQLPTKKLIKNRKFPLFICIIGCYWMGFGSCQGPMNAGGVLIHK